MGTTTLQHQMAGRFESLLALRDGWLDGKGLTPDKRKLQEINDYMAADYPPHIPLPLIVPTPAGNLLFEWALPGDPSVDLDLHSMRASFHIFLPARRELEREFRLTSERAWGQFSKFLDSTLDHHEA